MSEFYTSVFNSVLSVRTYISPHTACHCIHDLILTFDPDLHVHRRLRKHIWDIAKCPYYRGVHIARVSFKTGSTVYLENSKVGIIRQY